MTNPIHIPGLSESSREKLQKCLNEIAADEKFNAPEIKGKILIRVDLYFNQDSKPTPESKTLNITLGDSGESATLDFNRQDSFAFSSWCFDPVTGQVIIWR